MSPIFCTSEVSPSEAGDFMKTYMEKNEQSMKPRRLLVGGMSAKKIMLASPLLQWYLSEGLTVTRVYQVVEYGEKVCFKEFVDSVSNGRRMADSDKSMSVVGEVKKIIGNSAYGSVIMQKERHSDIRYVKGKSNALMKVNEPSFKSLLELEDDIYEIESHKRKIVLDLPIQIAFFILQRAKLHMLQFYYNVIDKYIPRSMFQALETDTDSFYAQYASDSFEKLIKPHLKNEFMSKIDKRACGDQFVSPLTGYWFPRECCKKHSDYDKRTSGLFKLECIGDKMISLCSKTYIVKTKDGDKMSCKGVNKNSVKNPMQIFESVLRSTQPAQAVNRGFRYFEGSVQTYKQQKCGFNYIYLKRELCENGIDTLPLKKVLTPWMDNNMFIFNEKHILAPFYICSLKKDSYCFNSIEQLLFYEKACFHKNNEMKKKSLNEKNPYICYRLQSKIKPSHCWYDKRDKVMKEILLQRREGDENVRKVLMENHGKILVYANDRCKYWSSGLNERTSMVFHPDSFPQQNMLGHIWMEIQKELV
jgi:ribA/ribD-fused uncharacterized protein